MPKMIHIFSHRISIIRFWTAITGFLGLLICGFLVFLYVYTQDVFERVQELEHLSGKIIFYDEVLTMSARMAVMTGDVYWIERYNHHASDLDQAIKELIFLSPNQMATEFAKSTDAANLALVEIETMALAKVKEGKMAEAKSLMFSSKYDDLKQIYSDGIQNFHTRIERDAHFRHAQVGIGSIIGVLVFIILFVWARVFSLFIRKEKEIEAVRQKEMGVINNLAMMGECTGNICHEIATPLCSAGLLIEQNEMILNRMIEEVESMTVEKMKERLQAQVSVLKSLTKTIHRVDEIITSTKEFYRKDETSHLVKKVNLTEILTEVMDYTKDRARKARVSKLDLNLPPSCEVFCRRVQLVQVLVNLVHNACDAAASKSERWIRIDVQEKSEGVLISVTDSGTGVPAEILEKVFSEGLTTKANGQGTGLGLKLSRNIVESWGGHLLYDEKSPNTRFEIFVPAPTPEKNKIAS